MRYKLGLLALVTMFVSSADFSAESNQATCDSPHLPPIETFFLEPIQLESVSAWVPATKVGPDIHTSCEPQKGCMYSSILPASVVHTKTEFCPRGVARLLAEYAGRYHEQSLPLTRFDGWRWEYTYSLCQSERGTYDLLVRGSSWENSWEAVLTQSVGSANLQWIQILSSGTQYELGAGRQESRLEVETFSSMRTRDGYPKRREVKVE
jgi:hypothetical protein